MNTLKDLDYGTPPSSSKTSVTLEIDGVSVTVPAVPPKTALLSEPLVQATLNPVSQFAVAASHVPVPPSLAPLAVGVDPSQ